MRTTARDTDSGPSLEQVELDAADFWQLRALIRDVQLLELDLARIQADIQQKMSAAIERRERFLAALVAKYPELKDRQFHAVDETCSLAVTSQDVRPSAGT